MALSRSGRGPAADAPSTPWGCKAWGWPHAERPGPPPKTPLVHPVPCVLTLNQDGTVWVTAVRAVRALAPGQVRGCAWPCVRAAQGGGEPRWKAGLGLPALPRVAGAGPSCTRWASACAQVRLAEARVAERALARGLRALEGQTALPPRRSPLFTGWGAELRAGRECAAHAASEAGSCGPPTPGVPPQPHQCYLPLLDAGRAQLPCLGLPSPSTPAAQQPQTHTPGCWWAPSAGPRGAHTGLFTS